MPGEKDAAAKSATAPKKARPQVPPKPPQAVRSGPAVRSTSESNKPASQFTYVLGPQEKALHDYLRCVFDPDKYQARVPNSTGGFELYTELWKTQQSGTAVAGPDGAAAVGVCANNWVENANADGVPNAGCSILGYTTNGYAVIHTTGAAALASTVPLVGTDWGAVANYGAVRLPTPTDAALTATSRIRLVAIKLAIHSVMAADTSRGEIMLIGSANPAGEKQGGAINGSTWTELVDTNANVVTRAVRGLGAWKSGEVISIVGIPAEQQAFEMCQVGANGYNATVGLTPIYNLYAWARSMQPGDSFSYDVTYVWETELAKTNSVSSSAMLPVPIPSSTLDIAKSRARPYAINPVEGIHSLPWVETLSVTNPGAVRALSRHPDLPKETALALVPRPSRQDAPIVYAPQPDFISQLGGLAKTGLKFLGSSPMVSKIPVIGGAVSAISSVLSKLFD